MAEGEQGGPGARHLRMRADAARGLIEQVGARVREARQAGGLPRRALSEISGVSPRYLAQLEAGKGNISIALLFQLAGALDRPMEWFIRGDEAPAEDVDRFAALFAGASAARRRQVIDLLDPSAEAADRLNRICLIGLRGAGKSSLGARAAKTLGLPFVELNHEIETHSEMPLTEIIALYGQEGYRMLEAQAVERVVNAPGGVVMAVAGGIVSATATYDRVLRHFHTVWIKASPEEHMERVRAQGDLRPMSGQPAAMQQLKSLLRDREALYRRAEAELDTSGQAFEDSLGALLDLIDGAGFTAKG